METPTLQELLKEPGDLREQVEALDYAMNTMVALLRHDPLPVNATAECYGNLYLLRKALETYKPGEDENRGN